MSADQLSVVKDLETELGVPLGFFQGLLKEDPWSFVIKLCAFFQTLLALTIAKQFDRPDLFPEFSSMPFAEQKAGLITLGLKTEAIDKDTFKFFKALAEIRNNLAHNVKFVTFEWGSYYQSLNQGEKSAFNKNFAYWAKGDVGISKDEVELLLQRKPQQIVHAGALYAVHLLYLANLRANLQKLKNEQGRLMIEERLANTESLKGLFGLLNLPETN